MQSEQFQLHAEIEQQHWWFVARRQIMRRLVNEVLPPDRRSLVIDVGCGTGGNIAALADQYRCLGIDTSAEGIALAQQRFPAVEFLTGLAPADLGPAMGEARLLLLMDVLEHVPDDFAVLSQLLATATPGTHFFLTVPADNALWSEHDESFGHYRRYDRDRLQRVWDGLPVRVRLLSALNSRLYWVIRAIRLRNRLRGKAAGAAGTDFWLPRPTTNRLLQQCFAGEAERLLRIVRGRGRRPYRRGASLIAILERLPGEIACRTKPAGLPPDRL